MLIIQKHLEVYGCYRDEPHNKWTDSKLFKSKIKIKTGNTPADGNTKDVETAVSLKYFSNFWITLEMLSINCEINLMLTRSSNCVVTNSTDAGTFAITHTKLYIPKVTRILQEVFQE